jgi:hypothetical protein
VVRFVEIDNASHGLIWTHADDVNRHPLDFLIDGAAVGGYLPFAW